MDFLSYVEERGINENAYGHTGNVYRILTAWKGSKEYRVLSLLLADLPNESAAFERLWNEYETLLDCMQRPWGVDDDVN